MKGTEKILAQINADGVKKAEELIARAEEQCSQIRQDCEKQARELYAEKIRAGVTAGQEKLEQLQEKIRQESRERVLQQRKSLVEQSFSLAADKLAALPEKEYRELLVKLALRAAEEARGELQFNYRDRGLHAEAVLEAANEKLEGDKLSLSDNCGSFKGGLKLCAGSRELDYTLETLAAKLMPELYERIESILFD